MNHQLKSAITKLKEVKELLRGFSNKEVAVAYLMEETKLSKDECSKAYDFIIKVDLGKI